MTEKLQVTVEEAAEMLSMSRTSVYGMIASGELESVRYNGMRRVAVAVLRRWMDVHSEGGTDADAAPVQPTTKWSARRRRAPARKAVRR